MTLRLTVDEQQWRGHFTAVAEQLAADGPGGLLPVVKGNGYGFGRAALARIAADIASSVAVGTIHETDIDSALFDTVLVLTPTLDVPDDLPANAVLTIGCNAHLDVVRRSGRRGRVAVKLESSMHRYGIDPESFPGLVADIATAGLDIHSYMLHPPLLGNGRTEDDFVDEVGAWLDVVDPSVPLSVSHIGVEPFRAVRERHPDAALQLRLGTALWHGDKSFLHLEADVLDVRAIGRASTAGYRLMRVNDTARLVMIGAGSAHGVTPLADGRSPFHFARERLTLLEPPHMHTSMALVGNRQPCPEVGDRVDVQRPLTTTWVDEVVWR